MVMGIPPKYSIAEVMGKLKSQAASQMREQFPWLEKVYWKENIVWSPGYFVSSVVGCRLPAVLSLFGGLTPGLKLSFVH